MTRLADADARELACREFERPVALEAGAGTGKTRALVARVGTWLLGPGWERAAAELAEERSARGLAPAEDATIAARACEGVAAITFTDAAAAELAGRVDALLGQAAAGDEIEDLDAAPSGVGEDAMRRRGGALLAASSRLRLSTIHGFCHRVLAESPLEAGLHPSFEVDADGEATVRVATGVLLERLRRGDPGLVALLGDGIEPGHLLETLVALAAAGVTPEELRADPFDEATLRPAFDGLVAAIDRILPLAAPARDVGVPSIPKGLDALAALAGNVRDTAPSAAGLRALAEPLDATTEGARKILGSWAKGSFGAKESGAAGLNLDALAVASAEVERRRAALAELDPEGWRRAADALAGPLAEVRARRRAEGIVSFDDLLAKAATLLADRRGVRDRTRRGLRQLLVDEFQDTDRRQCDLVRLLGLEPSSAPAPGLFVVGDPKQSIYGWRSADLAAYEELVASIDAAGGVRARLEVNFRSAPPILDEVERALAPVLVAEPGVQAAFQPLRPSPRRAGDSGFDALGRAPVEYWLSASRSGIEDGAATRSADATAVEARALARDVRELVDAGTARYRDFALLLRARGDLEVFLDELRRSGIPYVVQKDRSYYRRREVVDAAAGVRAILDPDDLLALVAFLRSPFVGVPDAAWRPLWSAGFPAAMIELDGASGLEAVEASIRAAAEALPAGLPKGAAVEDWTASLLSAVAALGVLRAEFRALPAGEWIERLRARLLFEPIAASRFLGRFGLANLERLLADLERRLAEEPDPGRALAELRTAIAGETPAEEARPPELDDDAVSVMTIHAAKGLQFRHVVIAQAHRRGGGPPRSALPTVGVGPPGERRESVLLGLPTPGWRDLEAARRRVADAETARLLYVAATRAIDRLVVCGDWTRRSATRRAPDAAPRFLDLLARRLDDAPDLSTAAPEAHDGHGALWRLADRPPDGDATSGEPTAPGLPRPGLDAVALGERRRKARARRERRRFSAASGVARDGRLASAGAPVDEPSRRRARALGVALHRALELEPLHRHDAAAWRAAVERSLAREPDGETGGGHGLDAALDRLLASTLWRRLAELEPHVVARELPMLVSVDDSESEPDAPTDGWVGTVDLLYRDPEDGAWVVADFKSDALEASEIDAKVATYRPQLELYGRAVRDALGLDEPPRLELWLLHLDRIAPLVPPSGVRQTE